MKKLLTFILIYNCGLDIYSQNLIPNGDFELGPLGSSEGWMAKLDNTCSSTESVLGPDNWIVLDASPDRLIDTDIHCDFDISLAQSGNAFINLIYLEAGKTTLFEALKKDSIYKMSGYYKLNTFNGLSNQLNRFYVKFSDTNDSLIFPYTNHSSWEYFDTIFIAKAEASEIELWANEFVQSGVYIDNLVLEKINLSSITEKFKEQTYLYPNPNNGAVFISNLSSKFSQIIIFNIMGEKVFNIYKSEIYNDGFDISNLDNGIYTLQIICQNKISNFSLRLDK